MLNVVNYDYLILNHKTHLKRGVYNSIYILAGKKTDEAEIERMLESDNTQIFTEGVSLHLLHAHLKC